MFELKITPNKHKDDGKKLNLPNGTAIAPFYFVSDHYTALEMKYTLNQACWPFGLDMVDPIPFNSTGNIRPGSVVQYYRGDSAAIVLEGYDNAMELPGRPDFVHDPSFPPNVNLDAMGCFNATIQDSIPLMHGWVFPGWGIALSVLLPLFALLCLILVYCLVVHIREYRNRDRSEESERMIRRSDRRSDRRPYSDDNWPPVAGPSRTR